MITRDWVQLLGRHPPGTQSCVGGGGAHGFLEASGFQQPLSMAPTPSGTTCGAPIPVSLRAQESETLFNLGCDPRGPGERG